MVVNGYRKPPKHYRLTWAPGHEMAGLEVVMASLSVDDYLELTALNVRIAIAEAAAAESFDPVAYLSDLRKIFEMFAAALVRWNLQTEEGKPVPADFDHVRTQESDFILAVIREWRTVMATAPPPLPPPSGNGATPAPEESLPMEVLPSSPGS